MAAVHHGRPQTMQGGSTLIYGLLYDAQSILMTRCAFMVKGLNCTPWSAPTAAENLDFFYYT
jgi:hypothetical protein